MITVETTILISIVSVSAAIYFGLSNKRRNDKNDAAAEIDEKEKKAKEESKEQTLVMIKMEAIIDDLKEIKSDNRNFRDEIKRDNKEIREEIGCLRERIVKVESSLKSYHKRLDGEQV